MKGRYSCSIYSFFIKATRYGPGLVLYCGKACSSHLGKPSPSQCPKQQGERRGPTLPEPSRSQRWGTGFPMGDGVTERYQDQNSSTDAGSGQGRKHQSPPCPPPSGREQGEARWQDIRSCLLWGSASWSKNRGRKGKRRSGDGEVQMKNNQHICLHL